jgi:hypothetical protein
MSCSILKSETTKNGGDKNPLDFAFIQEHEEQLEQKLLFRCRLHNEHPSDIRHYPYCAKDNDH